MSQVEKVDVLAPGAVAAAIKAARDPIIVSNALTRPDGYSPYCLRCSGWHRMSPVGLLHWRHDCGAEHDEREARAALRPFTGERA